MKKNNIDIEITGLDFLQDVEPLIKEFFPGFLYRNDVLIDIEALGDSFSVSAKEVIPDEKSPDLERPDAGDSNVTASDRETSTGTDYSPDSVNNRAEQKKGYSVSEKVEFSSDTDEKIRHRDYRNRLLKALYRVLHDLTGKTLPWGILTGVRPTKLLFERLERGEAKPLQFMEENYYCSREKASLAARVAAVEYKLLDALDYKNGYSLYIGIPFCPSICNYCTFGSHPITRFADLVEPYVEALMKEIREVAKIYGNRRKPGEILSERMRELYKPRRLQTVYFGGGTPTSLSAGQLRRIIRCVKDNFDMSTVTEFCVEAGRPDSITEEKLLMLKEEGISRISINPQTFSPRTLDIIGREHSPEQVIDSFMTARRLGFENINMDIIAGLTGEEEKDFANTLDHIKMLDPDSLTVHTLAHKRAARITTNPELYEEYEKNGERTADHANKGSQDKPEELPESADGSVAGMLKLSEAFAKENGYIPYYMYRQKNMTDNLENVGYAKPGKECLYNILIMEEVQPILAVGAGASTKFPCAMGDKRFGRVENVKNVREYINRTDEMIERKKHAFS